MSLRAPSAAAALLAAAAIGWPAGARAEGLGGTVAPSAQQTGGSEYGVVAASPRPELVQLSVSRTVAAGALPRVSLRVEEPGVATVAVKVIARDAATRRAVLVAALGWVRTGRTLTVRWAAGATLPAGAYLVYVNGHDHRAGSLTRAAKVAAATSLTVSAPPAPAPAPAPPASAPPTEAGVPGPSAPGAVFPVVGPHSFGGPENRFGAPRGTHTHQGQDVLTSEGTPVVAPLAGTIAWTSYQAGGAGYYAVEHSTVGLDFMFAHCQAGSLAVSSNQAVAAGQRLCAAGQTGDASTPHLHFEIWVGGWQTAEGHPIDPLPYLEAWERAGA